MNPLPSIKYLICKAIARYKSENTYPDSLNLDLQDLFTQKRKIKIAIIDNEPFPWREALESRGYSVTIFDDYTKSIKQGNQKVKTHNFATFDIVICDINDIGTNLYPGTHGVGVLEELREKLPLHVIAAYTGSAGRVHSKMSKLSTIDFLISKEWSEEDFLLNLSQLVNIFKIPKNRWEFIRKRLQHLSLSDTQINEIRIHFVENVILGRLLRTKFNCSSEETKKLVMSPNRRIRIFSAINTGVKTAELASFVSPFFMS